MLIDKDITLRIYHVDSELSCLRQSGQICDAGKGIRYGLFKGKQTAFIAFHTAALAREVIGHAGEVTFGKSEIDGPHKDHRYSEQFSISLDLIKPEDTRATLIKQVDDESRCGLIVAAPSSLHLAPTDADLPRIEGSHEILNKQVKWTPNETHTEHQSQGRRLSARVPHLQLDFSPLKRKTLLPPMFVPPLQAEVHEDFLKSEFFASTFSPTQSFPGPNAHTVAELAELELAKALHETVAKACYERRTYHQGKILDNSVPQGDGRMPLYYVVSGRVSVEPTISSQIGGWSGCLGMPDASTMSSVGPGEIFGLLTLSSVVPGAREMDAGLVYRVKSPEAVIATVCLPRRINDGDNSSSARDREAGLTPPALDDRGLCVVYESISRQLCKWSLALRSQLKLQKLPVRAHRFASPSFPRAVSSRGCGAMVRRNRNADF